EGPLLQTLLDTGLWARLRRLELSGNQAFGERALRILLSAQAPRLEQLGLLLTNVRADGLRALLATQQLPRLSRLTADFHLLFPDRVITPGLLASEILQTHLAGQLETFRLHGISVDQPALEALLTSPLASR